MQDETPANVVPRDKQSGKPFLRTQRLVSPRMVQSPILDSVARWKLCIAAARVVPEVDSTALQDAREKREPLAPVFDEIPELKAVFDSIEQIARMYLKRLAWGWNELPGQREKIQKALERVQKHLEKIATHRNQVGVKAKAATKLMAIVAAGGELEHRLIEAGWPLDWPDEVMPRPLALVPGAVAALAELANDDPDTNAGLPKAAPGAPPRFAEREAFCELAVVWQSVTCNSPGRRAAEHDGTDSAFAEFFAAVLRAARPGFKVDGTWWVQVTAKQTREPGQG